MTNQLLSWPNMQVLGDSLFSLCQCPAHLQPHLLNLCFWLLMSTRYFPACSCLQLAPKGVLFRTHRVFLLVRQVGNEGMNPKVPLKETKSRMVYRGYSHIPSLFAICTSSCPAFLQPQIYPPLLWLLMSTDVFSSFLVFPACRKTSNRACPIRVFRRLRRRLREDEAGRARQCRGPSARVSARRCAFFLGGRGGGGVDMGS